jgi:hypothetical protein
MHCLLQTELTHLQWGWRQQVQTAVCCYQNTWWHLSEVTAMRTGSLPWFLSFVIKFDCGAKYVAVEQRYWHYKLTFNIAFNTDIFNTQR